MKNKDEYASETSSSEISKLLTNPISNLPEEATHEVYASSSTPSETTPPILDIKVETCSSPIMHYALSPLQFSMIQSQTLPILTGPPMVSTPPAVSPPLQYTHPLTTIPAPFLLASLPTYYPIEEVTIFNDETQAERDSCNDEDIDVDEVEAEKAALKEDAQDDFENVLLPYDVAKALKAGLNTQLYRPWLH